MAILFFVFFILFFNHLRNQVEVVRYFDPLGQQMQTISVENSKLLKSSSMSLKTDPHEFIEVFLIALICLCYRKAASIEQLKTLHTYDQATFENSNGQLSSFGSNNDSFLSNLSLPTIGNNEVSSTSEDILIQDEIENEEITNEDILDYFKSPSLDEYPQKGKMINFNNRKLQKLSSPSSSTQSSSGGGLSSSSGGLLYERTQAIKIVDISCTNHICALTDNGEVYTWGNNQADQLGLGDGKPNIVSTPTRIDSLRGVFINLVACGGQHTLAYSSRNYSFLSYSILTNHCKDSIDWQP